MLILEGQMSLFNDPPLKIHNKVRLIELFSGIGAQAKALERLGVDFEHYRAYDNDKYAVASYNAIHGTQFVVGDVTKIHAEDLGIVDRDKYTYIMTYSFPCQDLSLAGKQKGMSKGSGTRSGLLWEVERLLHESCGNLPQVLLMENVPQVVAPQNKYDFDMWRESLDSMGYTSFYTLVNAKEYGVPQSRTRCFMLSWLGKYSYEYPLPIPLNTHICDVLEENVDKKYYLTDEQIKKIAYRDEKNRIKGSLYRFRPLDKKSKYTYCLKTVYRSIDNAYVKETTDED